MDFTHGLGLLIGLSLIFSAAIYRFPAVIWTAYIGIGWLLLSVFGFLSTSVIFIFWICFLLVAGFVHLSQYRQTYLLKPSLKKLQQQIPTISDTEREALEAGHTWWEKELFSGTPQWNQLFQIPKPTLTQVEQDFLNNEVETVCSMLNDWDIVNKEKDLPQSVWEYLKNEKFFGLVIPKEYGGLGFSALAHSSIVVKIA